MGFGIHVLEQGFCVGQISILQRDSDEQRMKSVGSRCTDMGKHNAIRGVDVEWLGFSVVEASSSRIADCMNTLEQRFFHVRNISITHRVQHPFHLSDA